MNQREYALCVLENAYQAQVVRDGTGARARLLELPPAEEEVLPGIQWGRVDRVFSPAFWTAHSWLKAEPTPEKRIGDRSSFKKEVAACLLGGYGITFELNSAAFHALDNAGLFDRPVADAASIEKILSAPISVGGRQTRYRFPRRKSKYLAEALNRLAFFDPTEWDDIDLRRWLTSLSGVGYKTASWIVRNWKGSDQVAIIDVHIFRAGIIMGLFHSDLDPTRHYCELERRFLEFARRIAVAPSELDILMWEQMRASTSVGIQAARERSCKI